MKITAITKPVKIKDIKRSWQLIDVKDQVLGRVAGRIARILQGKHKVNYVSYLDCGDYVVVINAEKIKLTGKKEKTKLYRRYTGYPGGLRSIPYQQLKSSHPERIIIHAVSGMLPKNKLRDQRLARLFVFPDDQHPYQDKFKVQNLKLKAQNKKS